MRLFSVVLLMVTFLFTLGVQAQAITGFVKTKVKRSHWLRIDAVEYRAAKYTEDKLQEKGFEKRNKGGLIHVYMTNVSGKEQSLLEFNLNQRRESYWLLGRYIAWHRTYDEVLSPGESTVLEINAIDQQFSEGSEYNLALIGTNWQAAGLSKGVLHEDHVRVSSMVLDTSLNEILFHVRTRGEGEVEFLAANVVGHETASLEWYKDKDHAIGSLKLKKALEPGELIILQVHIAEGGVQRIIHAHRRAYLDSFPIGVWKSDSTLYDEFKGLHIDTLMNAEDSNSKFLSQLSHRALRI